MSEETTNNEVTSVYIQTIDFKTLLNVTERINYVFHLVTYQLPQRADVYVNEDSKISSFVLMLIDYNNPANGEDWRLEKKNAVQYSIDNEVITIDGKKLFDVKKCIVIPDLKSIFIVPGEKSLAEGGFRPSEAVSLTTLISTMPLEMVMGNIPDENDKNKSALSITFKPFKMPHQNNAEKQ